LIDGGNNKGNDPCDGKNNGKDQQTKFFPSSNNTLNIF
jgi:hypothetical protein